MGKMNKKKVTLFTVLTLVITAIVMVAVSLIYQGIEDPIKAKSIFQGGMAFSMFIPLIMALVVKADFKGMGWKPQIRKNINNGRASGAFAGQVAFRISGFIFFQPFLLLISPDTVWRKIAVIIWHDLNAVHFSKEFN